MRRIYRKIRDHEMPTGLKLILGFYLFTTIFSFWDFFQQTSMVFLGQRYSGFVANWISFTFLLFDILWIIALIKRLKWGWKLFIVWSLFIIVIGFVSSVETIMSAGRMKPYLTGLYVLLVCFWVTVCSYVYQKRHYFSR